MIFFTFAAEWKSQSKKRCHATISTIWLNFGWRYVLMKMMADDEVNSIVGFIFGVDGGSPTLSARALDTPHHSTSSIWPNDRSFPLVTGNHITGPRNDPSSTLPSDRYQVANGIVKYVIAVPTSICFESSGGTDPDHVTIMLYRPRKAGSIMGHEPTKHVSWWKLSHFRFYVLESKCHETLNICFHKSYRSLFPQNETAKRHKIYRNEKAGFWQIFETARVSSSCTLYTPVL